MNQDQQRTGRADSIDIDAVPKIARSIFGGMGSRGLLTEIGDDDCAVLKVGGGYLVATTDLMNHRPALMTLPLENKYLHYGYLLAAANLSDLLGSGAKPIGLLVGLLAPENMSTESAVHFFNGVNACCAEHGVAVIGGDTKRSPRFQGYGVAIGWAESEAEILLRNGSRANESVFVSGRLGDFNAAILVASKRIEAPDLMHAAIKAITRPSLAFRLSRAVAGEGLGTGGIDVSDGLGMDLRRLAKASGVGLMITRSAVPVGRLAQEVASRIGVDPLAFVFATGGDWQFAFTAPPPNDTRIEEHGARRIGVTTESLGCFLVSEHGERLDLPTFGHSDNRGIEFVDEVELALAEFSQRYA